MNRVFNDFNSEIMFNIFINKSMEKHNHAEVEFIYVLEGEIEFSINDKSSTLTKDNFVIFNSNDSHSYNSKTEKNLICELHISTQLLKSIIRKRNVEFDCNSIKDLDNNHDKIRSIIKEFVNLIVVMDKRKSFKQYSLAYQLLNELVSNYIVSKNNTSNINDEYDERIENILDYINRYYYNDITLSEVANELFMSPSYFSRFFKKNIGNNFLDYLTKFRLDKAVEKLTSSNSSITHIALETGFPSTNSFNKVFKKAFNSTPSEYRKENGIVKNQEVVNETSYIKESIYEKLKEYSATSMISVDEKSEGNNINIIESVNMKNAYNKTWNEVINMGSAGDLLNSNMQAHIILLKNKLNIKYVRFWNIFSEEMYIDISQTDNLNFDKIYSVLDFLVENQLNPFIELSFKDRRIHRSPSKAVVYNKSSQKIDGITQWAKLIKRFMANIINRYGLKRVEQWKFEFGKDDISNSDMNINYCDFYKETYRIIKKYSERICLGGAGFKLYDVEKLSMELKKIKEKGIEFDFISLMIYPYVQGEKEGEMNSRRAKDPSFVANKIRNIRSKIEDFERPIYITEWNNTISNRNSTNDSCYKGAYVVKNLIDTLEDVDMMSYWVGSDVFGEYFDSKSILNGGVGLVAKNGILKPSLYAFYFMNELEEYLVSKGENHILTVGDEDNYTLICHNYKHFNYMYYLKEEDEVLINDHKFIFENENSRKLNILLNDVPNGEYEIKIYSVNKNNGSVLDEWANLDYLDDLNNEYINHLKQICIPRLTIKKVKVSEQCLHLDSELEAHEICLIKFNKKIE